MTVTAIAHFVIYLFSTQEHDHTHCAYLLHAHQVAQQDCNISLVVWWHTEIRRTGLTHRNTAVLKELCVGQLPLAITFAQRSTKALKGEPAWTCMVASRPTWQVATCLEDARHPTYWHSPLTNRTGRVQHDSHAPHTLTGTHKSCNKSLERPGGCRPGQEPCTCRAPCISAAATREERAASRSAQGHQVVVCLQAARMQAAFKGSLLPLRVVPATRWAVVTQATCSAEGPKVLLHLLSGCRPGSGPELVQHAGCSQTLPGSRRTARARTSPCSLGAEACRAGVAVTSRRATHEGMRTLVRNGVLQGQTTKITYTTLGKDIYQGLILGFGL